MNSSKVLPLEALAQKVKQHQQSGEIVVLCHGTFDLLHAGHIHHLKEAKKLGDQLCVTLTADAFVNKGPGRPVFNEQIRAEVLAALEVVDYVAINEAVTSENVIQSLRPDVYVKGAEYAQAEEDVTGNISKETRQVEAYGGKVVYTDGITFSSSNLLNQFFDVFDKETRSFLQAFKQQFSLDEVLAAVASLSELKVAVLGEAIIDEYHYTEAMGQIGKGTALGVKYLSEEKFAGGAIAVANHIAGFVDSVALLTVLGADENENDAPFIRQKLRPNVMPVFGYTSDAPTIRKRRFVASDGGQDRMGGAGEKLFEVYYYQPQPDLTQAEATLCTWMQQQLEHYDAVVVPDFGNGSISDKMIATLAEHSAFLAVNTQLNSGNRGYHVITRYPKADFISLNEPELRLATHDRYGDLEQLGQRILQQLKAQALSVTRGAKGVLNLSADGQVHSVPALATKVVDRIGAGDAYLSITAILLAKGHPFTLASFVGSIAAALDVQIVCNREPIDPVLLKKTLTTYLK